jgi:hypothetical protein
MYAYIEGGGIDTELENEKKFKSQFLSIDFL